MDIGIKHLECMVVVIITKEQDIQTSIMNYISSIGGLPLKFNNIGIYAKAGVSDIIACIKGRFVAIEVKRPGKKPTQLQVNFIKAVNTVGGLGFWADSLDEVKDKLKEII